EKEKIIGILDDLNNDMVKDSRAIWGFAEEALMEFNSSRLLIDRLKDNGFDVMTNVGGMETAFVGFWGEGPPVVGIIAEYDALPGCGPPVGENGHGCGHNLYSVASVYAAIAVKNMLE
ncbi:MAG: amidohydrolase, partial [Desulfobacterales bacterium]|nr:amidohydrolase [Desulfobacterales bacterium]